MSHDTTIVEIDGSFGEGGGQIIRTSVSLAALTGRPVRIRNVRAKRSRPGLQPQHLTAVRAAATLCAADLQGAETGSTSFLFVPSSPVQPGKYRFDIGTAGATGLVAQTVLIPLAHAGAISQVHIIGGTHVPHAPVAEYVEQVYVPTLQQAGLGGEFSYEDAGFFPRGGGKVQLVLSGNPPDVPVDLVERGKLTELRATVVTSNLPEHVSERGVSSVAKAMKAIGRKIEIERRDLPSPGQGAAVVLVAECENGRGAFTGLGERGKPMENVAQTPCEEFVTWWKSGAAVDEHLADQLVLPMSLVRGESRWSAPTASEHLQTVLWLAEHFLPIEYQLEEQPNGSLLVTLRGGI